MACSSGATLDAPELGVEADESTGLHSEPAKHCVFIAEDQEEVSRAIAIALEGEFRIVGLTGNGRDVLRLVPKLCPEILVLDVAIPMVNGIEAAVRLRAAHFPTKIVFLTIYEDADFLDAAMSAGAKAYVSKAHLATDLVPAIRNVLDGGSFVSPAMNLPNHAQL